MTTDGKAIELQGPVTHIGPVETLGQSAYQKRTLVLSFADDKYPRLVPVAFGGKLIDRVDKVQVGDEVLVTCDITGREWQGRYFTELRGWKCEVKRKAAPKQEPEPSGAGTEDNPEGIPF